jgi:hypothetical protein
LLTSIIHGNCSRLMWFSSFRKSLSKMYFRDSGGNSFWTCQCSSIRANAQLYANRAVPHDRARYCFCAIFGVNSIRWPKIIKICQHIEVSFARLKLPIRSVYFDETAFHITLRKRPLSVRIDWPVTLSTSRLEIRRCPPDVRKAGAIRPALIQRYAVDNDMPSSRHKPPILINLAIQNPTSTSMNRFGQILWRLQITP